MDVSNHTIGSWQLHMTSEILYTYIWCTEEVIKPYGPLLYSRKHNTNLLTWFIITLCHLAKPTLQPSEGAKPAEEREELYGELWLRQSWAVLRACSCAGQLRPRWQHQVWGRGAQTLQFGLWGLASNNKKNKWMCPQPAHPPLPLLQWLGLKMRSCRGQQQYPSHTGSPTLLCPAASLSEEGLKGRIGLMQSSLSCLGL